MITQKLARENFDLLMDKVDKATGRDHRVSLLMQVGPVDAETIRNQMFLCYFAGVQYGTKVKELYSDETL